MAESNAKEMFDRVIIKDKVLSGILDKVQKEKNSVNFRTLVNKIESHLFHKYCPKGYLSICEPGFCFYRERCEFLTIKRHVFDKYHLNAN